MSDPTTLKSTNEEAFVTLVTEVTNKLQSGQPVDVEAYVKAAPEFEHRLRRLVSTVRALVDLEASVDGTSSSPSTASSRVPEALGDFQILREIGRGGMGIVYEARQLSLGRVVALKVLPFAAVLDGRQLQRFKNEA